MYLSQLQLNLRSRHVQRDISDAHNMHRRVLSGFPDGNLDAARRHYGVLYRLEQSETAPPKLLVQSTAAPDWGSLPEKYLLEESAPSTKALSTQLDEFRNGDLVRVRLRANPTKRLRTGNTEPGKRVALATDADRLQWFARRAQKAGLQVPSDETQDWSNAVHVTSESTVRGRRGDRTLILASSTFDGFLRIVDVSLVTEAVRNGVGPGKSYGFGLLSIARLA